MISDFNLYIDSSKWSVVNDSEVLSRVEVLLYVVIPETAYGDWVAVKVDARQYWIVIHILKNGSTSILTELISSKS